MTKYAIFNADGFPTAFYDPEINVNQIPTNAVEITEAQWLEFINNNGLRKFINESVVVYIPAPPMAQPRLVPKRIIVDRLQVAGKLEAARTALDAQTLYVRERWNARDSVYATDPDTIALLTAIGADPAIILAP